MYLIVVFLITQGKVNLKTAFLINNETSREDRILFSVECDL